MELEVLVAMRYLFSNIVTNAVMFLFFKQMYVCKYDVKWIYWLSYVAIVFIRTAVAFAQIPPLNMVFGLIFINVASVLLYKCTLTECFLYNVSFKLAGLFSEIMGTSLISAVSGETIDDVFKNHLLKFIGTSLSCILLILFSRWLTYFFKKEERSVIHIKEILFLTGITALEILMMMYSTSNTLSDTSAIYLFALSCGFLTTNIYIVKLVKQVTQIGKLQQDLSLSKQQSELQLKYYQALKEKQEVSRRAVHDAKKHLLTIEGLYSSGCTTEAIDYGVLLKGKLDGLNWGFTYKNKILETIIGSKLEQADMFTIKFIADVQDIDIGFMEDLDITAIFANLLDNSFEACLELEAERRLIEMHMIRYNDFVVLNISNPIASEVKNEGQIFKTTKSGHSGIGLSNVSNAIKKYDGNFIACVENNKFVVKILIPIK